MVKLSSTSLFIMLPQLKRRIFLTLEVWTLNDLFSRVFDYFIIFLIILNVIAASISTVEAIREQHYTLFRRFEYFSIIVFTIEYILRVWTCTIDEHYRHPFWGRIRYMLTPLALIDLIAFLPFYLPILTPDFRAARLFRLIKFFRFLKLTRYFKSLQIIGRVLNSKKEDLIMTFGVVVVLLFISGSLIYFLENEAQPESFPNVPVAMWWGVVTLTTVGYGDVYPITPLGRLLGALVAITGIGLFALPAGIIASGFAEVIEERKNEKYEVTTFICPHCGKMINSNDLKNAHHQVKEEEIIEEWD